MYENGQVDAEEHDRNVRDAASKNKHSVSTFHFSQQFADLSMNIRNVSFVSLADSLISLGG